MMKFLTYIILVLAVNTCFAQTQGAEGSTRKEDIYTMVEEMPQYPGGFTEMMKFIQSNIVYPAKYKELNVGGKAFLKFTVSKEGKIVNAFVLKGTGFQALDDEALRVINLMPNWTPGVQSGKVVDVYFNLPINFSLPTPYYMFNVANKSVHYAKTKEVIETGGKPQDIIELLNKDDGENSNLDIMYNLAVAYYLAGSKAKSCRYFENILGVSDEKITIITNSKEFIQKYCSN